MKNFLKLTAIFACAVLFGACSEDDTEDVGGSYVPEPVVQSIVAGNEKAVLTWYTPETNENVTRCQVLWVGPESTVSTIAIVEPGENTTFIMQDEGEPLVAGTYSVSLKSRDVTTGEYSNAVTNSVTIYDKSSYAVPEIETAIANEDGSDSVVVTWGDVSEDCDSVSIIYYDTYGITTKLYEQEISTGSTTILESAGMNSQILYTAYMKPADGYDHVVLSGSFGIDDAPYAPTIGSVVPGNERFSVTWNMSSIDDITAVVINYGDNSETIEISGAVSFKEGVNTYIVEDVTAGDYVISVQNRNTAGFLSLVDDTSEYADTVAIYSADTYSASVPALASVVNANGEVSFTFNAEDVVEDCRALAVSYQMSDDAADLNTVEIDITAEDAETYSFTGITNAYPTSPIYVIASFYPAGSLEDFASVTETSSETIPNVAPVAPILTIDEIGYDASDSYINLSWTVEDSTNVYSLNLYYGDNVVAISDITTTTSYTFTTASVKNPITVDTEYAIYITAVTKAGEESVASEIYNITPYNASSYDLEDLPTVTSSVSNETDSDMVTVSFGELDASVESITVNYGAAGTGYLPTISVVDGVLTASDVTFDFDASYATFTYTVVFNPEYAMENGEQTVTSEDQDIDLGEVAAPYDVVVVPSVTETGDAAMTVAWTLESAANVESVEFSYYSGDDATLAKTASVDINTLECTTESTTTTETDEDGVETEVITTTYSYEYEFAVEDAVVDGETTYSLFATSYNRLDSPSESSETVSGVVLYSASSYTIPELTSISVTEGVTTISWGGLESVVDEAIKAVTVYYYVAGENGIVQTSVNAVVAEGVVVDVVLTGAVSGTDISYTAEFCPEGSSDNVTLTSEGTYTYAVPAVATNVVASTGFTADQAELYVAWDNEGTPNTTSVWYSKDGADAVELSSADSPQTINVEAGSKYTVYVETDGEYATATTSEVKAYTEATYEAVTLPTQSAELVDSEVVVTWSNYDSVEDLYSVLAYYTDDSGDEQVAETLVADIASGTTFDFGTQGYNRKYSYGARFCPVGGVTPVEVRDGSEIIVSGALLDLDYNSETGYYVINTAKGLKAFSDLTNGIVNTTADVSGSGITFPGSVQRGLNAMLGDYDIDCSTICSADSGISWLPLSGQYQSQYYGTFDGNGKTIKNLYVNTSDYNSTGSAGTFNSEYASFVGMAGGATIQNVSFDNITVVGASTNTAGIIGYATSSVTISNCHILSGSVTGSAIGTGGIFGKNHTTTTSVTIKDCTNNATVSSTAATVGGIAAWIQGTSSIIENCHNSGDVYSTSFYIGGILGNSPCNIVACSNSGTIGIATASDGGSTSGIAGNYSGNNIIGCYNTGAVVTPSTSSTGCHSSGVAKVSDASVVIAACYNTGDLSGIGRDCGYVIDSYKADLLITNMSYCFYIDVEGDSQDQGCSLFESDVEAEDTISAVADITALNGKIGVMNTAIADAISTAALSLGRTYTYVSGTNGPTITYTED